eukprot:gene27023-30550_t
MQLRRLQACLARGVPDVVLLDFNFTPGRIDGAEGLALLDKLREHRCAVIALTAYADVPLAVEALKRGACDFITKPWDNARLVAAVDAALARRPAVLLVDELAHTNAPGSRHAKRWQDVQELLAAGIEVWSALNVQHLESLNGTVGAITGVRVHETVPDSVLDEADEVVLVDVTPDELTARLAAGKVYLPQQAERAAQNFFRNDAIAFLTALIMFVVKFAPPHKRTMQEIRDITAGPLDELHQIAEDMARSGISAIANPATTLLGKRREALATLRDTFNSELAVWDDPGVTDATREGLDFKSLKDQTATVYISVPFDKMEAYGSFLKIVLASALDAMLRNERQPEIPVLFVLDEFLSLGPFPQFRDAIRTHAGAGVRLWFFLQDLSTLEEHYPSSWKTFLNSAVKMFFGTNDAFTG